MAKVTKELKEKFKNLYENEKLSTAKIADLYNLDRGTVYYHLKNLGVTFRKVRKINLSDIESKKETPEFDYFLGILASDGCISGDTVSLEFAENNSEILTHWNNFLDDKCNINIHYNKKTDKTYYKIAFMNKAVCKFLLDYGITENKSLSLKLKYINWDVLRGIFDGDGSLSYDNRKGLSAKFRIASGSKIFLEQIQTFLDVYGIKSTIYKENNSNTLNLVVGINNDVYKIYNNMYKNASYFLKRKHEKFGPIVKKFTIDNSVNSGNEGCASNPEPSLIEEGAETRHGEPKLE